jgi:transposase
MRFDLTDEEWALLEPLMPKSRKSARVDDRKILNAIFYVLRTAARPGASYASVQVGKSKRATGRVGAAARLTSVLG